MKKLLEANGVKTFDRKSWSILEEKFQLDQVTEILLERRLEEDSSFLLKDCLQK